MGNHLLREMEPIASRARDRVGPYELLAEIARGGETSLWAGQVSEGPDLGRLVAVRRIRTRVLDAISRDRLRRGVSAVTRLRDPKVLAVLDVVVTRRELAVVSEYIDGETLRSLQRLAALRDVPLPVPVALRIGLDLLMGLGAAVAWHSGLSDSGEADGVPGSPHGCVAPDYVLVAGFGDTLVADLGLAGLLRCAGPIAEHPAVLTYAAPERFDPAAGLDERSDVFSVGVLLWELVANRTLFEVGRRETSEGAGRDADMQSLIQKVCSAPIPRLNGIRRAGSPVPSRVADVVARALQRDPASRFSTLDEMARAIRGLDCGVATDDEVVAALDRVARPVLEARRAALGLVERRARESASPGASGSGTGRPSAPDAPADIIVDIPRNPVPQLRLHDGNRGVPTSGLPAICMRAGLLPPVNPPARRKEIDPSRAPTYPVAEAARPDEQPAPPLTSGEPAVGLFDIPEPAQAASAPDDRTTTRKRRRAAVAAGVALLAAFALVAGLVSPRRAWWGAPSASMGAAASPRATEVEPPTAPTAEAAAPLGDPAPSVTSGTSNAPAEAAPSAAPGDLDRGGPPAWRPPLAPRGRSPAATADGKFRPRGI